VSTVGQTTVCYGSGVAPTISKHLVYTLSNNCHLHQCTHKSSMLVELLHLVHCLKRLFEKVTAPSRRKTISRYRKALCTTVLGLFSHLKF